MLSRHARLQGIQGFPRTAEVLTWGGRGDDLERLWVLCGRLGDWRTR